MQKTHNYLLMLLMALVIIMAGCSSDSEKIGRNNGNNDGPVEYGYFAFDTRDAVIPTHGRANPDDDNTEAGRKEESLVHEIRVVLYDAVSGDINYTFNYTTSTANDGTVTSSAVTGKGVDDGTSNGPLKYFAGDYVSNGILAGSKVAFDKGIKTEGELLVLKNYTLVVLINPTDAAKDYTDIGGTKVKNYEGFYNAEVPADVMATLAGEGENGYEYKYFTRAKEDYTRTDTTDVESRFFMTNFQEGVTVMPGDMRLSKTDAEAAPVRVYVDRAVAKVILDTPTSGDESSIGTTTNGKPDQAIVSGVFWKLDRTNKTSYFMRHMAAKYDGAPEDPGNPLAPVSRYHYYAIDPNPDNISRERNPSLTNGIVESNFHILYNDEPGTLNSKAPDLGDNYPYGPYKIGVAQYALENTMVADEQYEDVTTAAIVQLSYEPCYTAIDGVTGVTGLDTGPGYTRDFWNNPGSSLNIYFVWVKGAGSASPTKYVFTAENLNQIKTLPENTEVPGFEEFTELWNFLNSTDAVTDSDGRSWPDGTAKMLEDIFGDPFAGSDNAKSPIVNGNQMMFFAGSRNYYRVLIRHFNDELVPTNMAYGRYGVVRNNIYRLTLNNVSGPGDFEIPEPNGPDDKSPFLSVDIRILPWVIRAQDVEL